MIIFKKLRWKNLLSTGNVFTEIDLTTHTTTLIVGENGAGKSTILDALSFGLFGKPFRKINKGQLINSINNKGLHVEVEFQIGSKFYNVKRGAKPTLFEISVDGVVLDKDASSDDYQDILERQILKINHKTFSQIVVLGSASFVPFMQMAAAHRREVIEDILDIQVFTTMNVLLKNRVALNRQSIMDNDYAIQSTEDKLEIEKAHLDVLKSNNGELIAQKQQQVDVMNGEINEASEHFNQLQTEIGELRNSISDQAKVRSRLEKVLTLSRQIDNRGDKIRKETEFFSTNHDCPTCRQGIADDHKSSIVEKANAQLLEIEEGKQKILEELDRINIRLGEIGTVSDAITTKQAEASARQVEINLRTGFIKSIEKEIEQLKQTTQFESNEDKLKELKVLLALNERTKKELVVQRHVLEAASVMLKDTGIKTKIIRQYIPVINKLINKYLASMDFFVNFELNENFEETLKSRFRDVFSYASFSEGEKSRIDLALLFTWRAISRLRNSTSTNLLILDEVFDGSLDAQGNEELIKIIKLITEGSNVFVISHKTDSYLDKFDRVLKFEKQKNFSRMIEL